MPLRCVDVARALGLAVLLWQILAGPGRAQSRVEDHAEPQVDAAKAADEISVGAAVDDSFSIFAMPIPIINPTIGNGLAVGVLGTFRLDDEDKVSPRSTVTIGGGYTDSHTYALAAGTSLYLDEDRFRIDVTGGGANANVGFYGIGSDSLFKKHPLDLNFRGSFVSANARIRLADHFYAGPLYKYVDATASFETAVPEILRPDDRKYRLSGAGLIAEYDSRDASFSPHTGTYGVVELTRFDERIGSEFNFTSLDGSVAHYIELTPDLVLAGQGRIAGADGDPPFFALPYITLRGFPGGKYLNDTTWQAEAELRWRVFWRIGMVVFAGLGQTAPDLEGLPDSDLLYSGGAGLRFVASESERVNLGIDVARANDGDTAVYFRIGEAF